MSSALRQADLLIFPSTYEGFGLPVLEAMDAGVPVVASRVASLPEVAGDAACYFDPLDIADMAAQIRKVAGDSSIRARLCEQGRHRATTFSWRRTAKETLDVYRQVIG